MRRLGFDFFMGARFGSYLAANEKDAANTASPLVLKNSLGSDSLMKCLCGFFFAVVYVEDRDQLGDLQQISHALREVCQFDGAPCPLRCRIQRYQSAQATRIDIVHTAELQHEAIVLSEKFLNRVT